MDTELTDTKLMDTRLVETFKNKRVFVTGHTGFKGAWLTQVLIKLGAKVCGYSIDIPTEPSFFRALSLEEQIEHHFGDIRDLKKLTSAIHSFQPEIIIHMAAQTLVRHSYEEPQDNFSTNVMGTVNVLEAVRTASFHPTVLLVASDKTYENQELNKPFVETDRLGGHDPYSASKACAEIAFHAYYKSFFANSPKSRVASVRAGNVVGGGDWAKDRLIPDAVRAWASEKTLTIRQPDSVRPWQHVLDALRGYLILLSGLDRGEKDLLGQSFNFGPNDDEPVKVREVLELMSDHLSGLKWQVDEGQVSGKSESKILRLDSSKANQRLSWYPTMKIKQVAEDTASWYHAYYKNPDSLSELTERQIARVFR